MQMIINGKFCDASDNSTINIVNPYNGKVIDTVPNATAKDVDKAVKHAQTAFKTWKNVSIYKRVEILNNFLDLVDEYRKDLAKTLCTETGKPITQAYAEIDNIRLGFSAFMEKAKHLYGNVIPNGTEKGQDDTLQMTIREPLGVVGAIIPFNFPCDLFDQKVAPALLAGNTVIVKPPHQNPLTLIKLTALMHDAGLPKGVLQVVTGQGAKSGNALARHPGVNAITFTGSTAVGNLTYKNCAEHLAHCSLELGGNDAFIVCEDADIDLSIEEMVAGRMYNTGQVCCASKRFIIHKSIADEWIEKAKARLKQLVIGNPADSKTEIGCLVTEQAAIKAENQIKEAIAEGGKLVYGGRRNGAFIEPTIIADLPREAKVMNNEEIFAPVVSVTTFDDISEAVDIANQSAYGLSGCVFTRDITKAFKVVKCLECGGTVINGSSFHRSFEMPFGGYKDSGIGTEGVMSTFDEVTKVKTITLKNIFK